jgi:hypothetical protein
MTSIWTSELSYGQRTRWERARSDPRIYVIDVAMSDDTSSYCLTIQGTTDIYTVTIPYDAHGGRIKCTCIDAKRNKTLTCKHVLNVCKALGLISTSDGCDESISATFEDSTILAHLEDGKPIEFCASEIDRITDVLNRRTGSAPKPATISATTMEDPCAICFEDITGGSAVFTCKTCKKSIHDDCWKAWKRSGKSTCVYCRAK